MAAAGVFLLAAVSVYGMRSAKPAASAANEDLVAAGHAVYAQACAVCHGRRLQGQPLWQVVDADSWRRAPALDATGHSWLRSDAALLRIVKTGRLPMQPADALSGMPAFGGRLSDADILSALAFIKSRWPTALGIVQASLNPSGAAGRQTGAEHWTFPVFCRPGL